MSDLTDGLVGWYKLDDNEVSFVVVDSSGEGNNGTANFTTSVNSVEGILNKALEFNGTTENFNIGQPSLMNFTENTDYSISFWVYIDSVTADNTTQNRIGLFGISQRHGINLNSSRQIAFGMRSTTDATYVKQSNETVDLTTWTKLGVTYDASTKTHVLYKNGVAVDSKVNALSGVVVDNNWLGSFTVLSGNSSRLDGKLDDIRVYNKKLSPGQDRELYELGQGIARFPKDNLTEAADKLEALGINTTSNVWAERSGSNVVVYKEQLD